jgi:eukaryotic-like serine/threonine-protein kinase
MSYASVVLAGRYRLESRIAVGGTGEVWRATDEVLVRPVAVKLLRAEYAQHPETLARFRSEGRHAGSLSHPGIAQVYDYGEAVVEGFGPSGSKLPYLVMELVDGPSLTEVLGRGPLDPRRVMDVVAQAAAGLAAAHRAGLVHRDIMPGNLVLGPDGQVKITDFGISHAAGSAPITMSGTLLGTPAYLAPERVAGDPATPASDLYSLGVVAWEGLAGGLPFTGAPVEVALAHRDRPLPPLPGTVPADVAALVAQLTAKDPRARPLSAGEVARRAGLLRDAMDSRSTLPLDTLSRGTARPGGRRRGRALSGKTVALSAGGLLGAAILGVLASGALGQGGPQAPAGPSSATAAARSSTLPRRTVEVGASSLVGQQISEVRRQLQQLGLGVSVIWQPSDQDPGTVLAVQPSGQVPARSMITVTAVSPTHHDRHRHGDGQGNGGEGNGDD